MTYVWTLVYTVSCKVSVLVLQEYCEIKGFPVSDGVTCGPGLKEHLIISIDLLSYNPIMALQKYVFQVGGHQQLVFIYLFLKSFSVSL